jgi:hypothetical protein
MTQIIDGLWIEMPSLKLKSYLTVRVTHHAEKAAWYKEQADRLSEQVAAESHVTNNPTYSLRTSQNQHEQKYTFFKMLAENLIPDATYRLSQDNCVRIELYAQYF